MLPPLSLKQRERAEAIAAEVAGKIPDSDPSLRAEVIAHLVASLLYDHGVREDDEDATAAQHLMIHVLHRVRAITDELKRAISALGKQ
jgi:hypothetical protein